MFIGWSWYQISLILSNASQSPPLGHHCTNGHPMICSNCYRCYCIVKKLHWSPLMLANHHWPPLHQKPPFRKLQFLFNRYVQRVSWTVREFHLISNYFLWFRWHWCAIVFNGHHWPPVHQRQPLLWWPPLYKFEKSSITAHGIYENCMIYLVPNTCP